MTIDIREDAPDFLAYIRRRVAQQIASQPTDQVGVMNFGFEMGQGNMVWLMFDTRPDARPDNTWTLPKNLEKTPRLDRPKWPVFHNLTRGQQVFFIDLQGRKTEVMSAKNTDELIHTIAGDAMKQALLMARAEGLFKQLPRAAKCPMFVENMEGFYSWPSSNDPAPDNMA